MRVSGDGGDAYAKYAARQDAARTNELAAAARNEGGFTSYTSNTDIDVPIDKLRSETKKYETAYDALVRGAKGTGS